ncbi:MAG: CRISPR-associated protein Cas7 [Bacteroidota bacterium]|nr:CRISPR-associated protein Cas7 [Bacteroidota bacterium]
MNNFIYLRGLRRVEHTVFCVQEGQKSYYDQQFGVRCAYSSGQQVKRSILDSVLESLNEPQAPITFNYEITNDKNIANKEPWSPCDPSYTDQLLGGWMRAQTGVTPVKRRSAFSISAMRPLHPLLGGLEWDKENLTFDRSNNPNQHPVIVKDTAGRVMTEEEIKSFLSENKRVLPRRNWIPDNTRATGLFIYDVAVDLRTLFCISTNVHEPELTNEIKEKLIADGWIKSKNVFGECLLCPEARRNTIIDAVAKGLIDWRITSNQSRTFSLMETLAIAISDNANKIAATIRADLNEEKERSAKPIIDRAVGANLFITLPCNGYIAGAGGELNALENAENKLKEMMLSFDYENQ